MKNKLILPLLLIAFSVNAQTPNYTATKFPNGLVPPSRSTAPVASPGSLWHDVIANAMKWYNGSQWVTIGSSGGITTETDPTVPSNVKAITATNISNWNTAFGWGNHASSGYATQAYVDARITQIVEITGTTQSAVAGTIYIPHSSSRTVITLPPSLTVGQLFQVVGEGTGGFRIAQNVGQSIVGVGTNTTIGTAGYMESTNANCTITLRVTNTNKLTITSSQGTFTTN